MKTKLIIACVIAFVLLTSFGTALPENASPKKAAHTASTDFSFFRTHRQGKNGITATWGVTSAVGVSSFYVQRTYEDPADPYAYWETWDYEVCSGAKSYKATDANVFPGFISYRVVAVMSNGNEFVSGISTVHIVSH